MWTSQNILIFSQLHLTEIPIETDHKVAGLHCYTYCHCSDLRCAYTLLGVGWVNPIHNVLQWSLLSAFKRACMNLH